ncbi:MAG: hypothetical protein EBE86_025215 [Hormoscilla sp. GUM202]|nr:hypothetical protein [Hormoscilla sp. GM7CHS1pb]MBO1350467.1 hypothetical protein [Hormoscilla sp. GUM202]
MKELPDEKTLVSRYGSQPGGNRWFIVPPRDQSRPVEAEPPVARSDDMITSIAAPTHPGGDRLGCAFPGSTWERVKRVKAGRLE